MKENGLTYFDKNDELAIDIVTVLDSIRQRLQYELKLNLRDYCQDFTPLNEVENEERELVNTL